MVSKDQSIGGFIRIICVAIATAYTVALFWPALEAIRLWLVAIPVLVALIAILGIGAWIGWTIATNPLRQSQSKICKWKRKTSKTSFLQNQTFFNRFLLS